MFFQSGWMSTESIHKKLQPSVDAWKQGKTLEAYQAAEKVRRHFIEKDQSDKPSSLDLLWFSEIAGLCGLHSRSKAIHYIAQKTFPEDQLVNLMYAWDCSAFGHFYKCSEILEKVKTSGTDKLHVLKLAIKVYNYSTVNWKTSAEKLAIKIRELIGENALIWYVLSRASAKRTDWQRSIKEGKKAIRWAPDWNYARAALVDPLIAVGDIDTAKMVTESFRPNLPNAYSDMSYAIFKETQNEVALATDLYGKIIERWPKRSHVVQFALRKRCLLLFQQGKIEQAEAIIKEHNFQFLKEKTKTTGKNKRRYISVPLISQTTNHCVPTVAAMVAGAQGEPANAVDYAEGMNTRHGTQIWQMIDFMKTKGFECLHIKPEIEIVKAVLDHQIPLIGSMSDVFSGHVDVLCGYDDHLEILHVRDPMHWHPTGITYDSLKSKYEPSGGLFLLLSEENKNKVQIPDTWLNPEGKALTQLSKACSNGEYTEAQRAYKEISDDHPIAFFRNCMACFVVTTDSDFQQQLEAISKLRNDDGEIEMVQLQAMLRMINQENADRIYQEAKEFKPELGRQFLNYIKAQCQMAKLQWKDSYETLRNITDKWPGNDTAWNLRSIVAEQLGDQKESERCLKIALEIAPESVSLLSRKLRLDRDYLPYADRLATANSLKESYVGNPDVFFVLAEVLSESEDGLSYRKSLIECSKFFPKHPGAYRLLSDWYLGQGRIDLAKHTNQRARNYIGEQEFPLEPYEIEASSETPKEIEGIEPDPKLRSSEDEAKDRPGTKVSNNTNASSQTENQSKQFIELMENLQEKIDNLSWEEFCELPEYLEVLEFDETQRLPWYQSATFTSMRVFSLLQEGSKKQRFDEPAFHNELKNLLPIRVSGVPELYANAVLDRIETEHLPRPFQKKLLAWIDRITDGLQTYAPLQFHRACLLEYLDKYIDSETILKSILKTTPAFIPAIYRMGCIQVSRKNNNKGKQLFKKCLKISPGHFGSLFYLRQLSEEDDFQAREKYSRRISMLHPFDDSKNLETAIDVGRSGEDISYGLSYLRRRKERVTPELFDVLISRYYLSFDRYKKAIKTIESVAQTERNELPIWWTLYDCYGSEEKYDDAKQCVEKILKKTSDDIDAREAMAKVLSFIDETKAKQYALIQINEKFISPTIANVALINEANPHQKALALIQNSPNETRELALDAFYEALSHHEDNQGMIPFLEFCCRDYPEKLEYKVSFAAHLALNGEFERAIELSNSLVKLQPENAQFLSLAGFCSKQTDPKKAVVFYEKEFSITGSVQTKLRIAELKLELQRLPEARKLLTEILETDKTNDYILTLLIGIFEDHSPQMFEYVCDALKANHPTYEPNFHQLALELSKVHQKPVPEQWVDSAIRQLEQSEDSKEKSDLHFRIRQWFNKWRDPTASQFGNWLTAIKVYFSNDRSWIPTRPYKKSDE